MKKAIYVVIYFLFIQVSFSQKVDFMIGTEAGFFVQTLKNPATKEKHTNSSFTFGPRIGLVYNNKLAFGLQYYYSFAAGYLVTKKEYPDLHGFGTFGRYYFNYTFKKSNLFKDRLRFYTEGSVNFMNFHPGGKTGVIITDKKFETNLRAGIGFDLRYGNFHLESSWMPQYFVGYRLQSTKRVGFAYWFQKGNKEKKIKLKGRFRREKKASNLNQLGERFIIGSSYTYIWDKSHEFPERRYEEYTWNIDAVVNLDKQFYLGLSYKDIRTSGSIIDKNSDTKGKYYMLGVLSQFDFIPSKKDRLFFEVSANYGNYCTCGLKDPYKVDGLFYLGFGAGFDYPILDWLSIDIAFLSYQPFNSNHDTYNYTQYIVGLNIDIIKNKDMKSKE